MRNQKFLLVGTTALMLMSISPGHAEDDASHLTQIKVTDAARVGTNTSAVTVAVLDGLAQVDHFDLGNVTHYSLKDGDFDVSTDNYTITSDNHGTHVAGIIGALDNGTGAQGVAAGANILSYGAFDQGSFYAYNLRNILAHAKSKGASVANASYGISNNFSYRSELTELAGAGNGVLFVKAAGNDGVITENGNYRGAASDLNHVLFVGSVDSSNRISSFSNKPGEACITRSGCAESEKYKYRFLVAPGEAINSTMPTNTTGRLTGTSMAAPAVAGAAALIHSRWAWLKDDAAKTADILLDSADDLGATGTDGTYGRGLLNVAAAMAPIDEPVIDDGSTPTPEPEEPAPEEPIVETPVSPCDGLRRRAKRRCERRIARGKRGKNLGLRASSIRGATILTRSALQGQTVTGFDKYGRDFTVALATLSTVQDNSKFVGASSARAYRNARKYRSNRRNYTSLSLGAGGDVDGLLGHSNAGLGFVAGVGANQILGLASIDQRGHQALISGADSGFNPVAGLAGGELFAAAGFNSSGNWRFQAGLQQNYGLVADEVSSEEGSDARALSFEGSYRFNEHFDLLASFTQLKEFDGLLGANGNGFFAFDSPISTLSTTLGFDYRINPRISLLGSYTTARSRQNNGGTSYYLDGDAYSDAFHLGLAASDVLEKNDNLSLGVSQPLRVRLGALAYSNREVIDRSTGATDLVTRQLNLAAQSRQVDVKMAYAREVLNGAAAFEVRAQTSFNEGHSAGQTGFSIGGNFQMEF